MHSVLTRSQDAANRLDAVLILAHAVSPAPTETVAQAQALMVAEPARTFCAFCPLCVTPYNRFDFLNDDEACVWACLACVTARHTSTQGSVCTWMATAVRYSYQGGEAALLLAEGGYRP